MTDPTDKKPNYPKAIITAENLLIKYGVTNPPVDPQMIARKLDIDVSYVHFKDPKASRKVSGFYDPREGANGKIYVNAQESGSRQLFTIAHEIGHACLHHDWTETDDYEVLMRERSADKNPPKEQEADIFAANLLVPRAMLLQFVDKLTVPKLARLFAVSEATIGWRVLRELNYDR